MALLLQASGGIWPVTVVGWLTTALAIASPFAFAFAAGRVYAKLNGYGGRLAKVEKMLAEHAGAMVEIRTAMQTIVGAQTELARLIGAATESAVKCNADTEALGQRIHDQIDALDKKVTDWNQGTALQLVRLTTELQTRGHIGGQPGGFAHQRDSDKEKR